MSQPTGDPQITGLVKDRAQRLALAWFPDDPGFCATGRCLVLGVVAWSVYDVRFLTAVAEAIARTGQSDFRVAVLDADELQSWQDFQQTFPGIGEVFHTPAVGYWEGGQLKETASGYAARELVGRLLGFDPKVAFEHPTAG